MSELKKGNCERCGKYFGMYHLDYCAHCSKDLCQECMQKGCCGHVPAESGMETDVADFDAITEQTWKKLHPQQ